MRSLSKEEVLKRIRDELKQQLSAVEEAVQQAREGLTVGDNRADNRGERGAIQEKSWLYSAQAERLEDLRQKIYVIDNFEVETCDTIGPGALVSLREEGAEQQEIYFLQPALGGMEVEIDGILVAAISPASPIGNALYGKKAGDQVTVELPAGEQMLIINSVR